MARQNRRRRDTRRHDDVEQLQFAPVMGELAYDPGIQVDERDEDVERLSRRMSLESSSNLYAQRRSQW